MKKKFFRKSVAVGILFLFIGTGFVLNGGKNVSASPSVSNFTITDTVGFWHFNEGSGSIAYDSSSYGNDGTCHSTQWVPGVSGSALSFSAASNSVVKVVDDPSLDFDDLGENEGFMIDFWMAKYSTPSPHYAGLVSKLYYGGYYVIFGTNGKITFYIGDGNTGHYVYSNTIIGDNNWHHIVAVWDRTSLYLYVDDMSNPDNSEYVGDFSMGQAGQNKWLDIGNDWPTDSLNPFNGKIDEVRISIIQTDGGPQPEDLSIIDVRPIQVRYLDEIDYHHPLVADKRTVARVYVRSTFDTPVTVDFKVTGDIDATEYLRNVWIKPNQDTWVIVPGGPREGVEDTWTHRWFYLSKGENKEITVKIDYNNRISEGNENNNAFTVSNIDVQESRSLGVGYVRMKSTWPDDFPTPGKSEFITLVSESDDFMESTFPIEYGELKSYYDTDPVDSICLSIWPDWHEDLLKLEKINWVGGGVDRTVGIVTEEYWGDQDVSEPYPAALTSTDVTSSLVEIGYWTATAHEIHHNLPAGDDWRTGEGKGGDEEYNRVNEEFPSEGFRMCDRRVVEYSIYLNHCFMTVAPQKNMLLDRLVCKECYEHLLTNLEKGDSLRYASSGNGKAIYVSGGIHKNGTSVLKDLYVMDNKPLDYPDSTDGNYSIQLFNSTGEIILNVSFEPAFKAIITPKENSLPGDEIMLNSTIFSFSLPFPDSGGDPLDKIILEHNDTVLAERIISDNSPSVEVLSPDGGEIFNVGDICTIQWQAYDNDGDELTYCVLYSTDDGGNWTAMTVDLNQTEYLWNTTYYIPSDTYKIKIIANDGFNTATDESNETFSLHGNIAPEIKDILVTPVFQINNYPVNISCKITDDDVLNMVNVNISGPYGFNAINVSMLLGNNDIYYYNITYFIPGSYNFTILAVDSQGETVSSTGRFIVYQSLVANFNYTPTNITTLDTIQFNDLSYDLDGYIVNWNWDFGDGNISYEQHPTHHYISAGNYTVSLTVTDDDSYTGSYNTIVTVLNVPPVAEAGPDQTVDEGDIVNFDASDSYGSASISDVTYNWIEISGTGTAVSLYDDDYTTANIGFTFNFYGDDHTMVYICSNGYLTWHSDRTDYSNDPIPRTNDPDNYIAPFWDDLNPYTGGMIYYETQGVAPNRQFIVEWKNLPHYYNTGACTFQAILYEGTNIILFQYQDVDFGDSSSNWGASATIGLEDQTGTDGLQFSYNSPSLTNNFAIEFYLSSNTWIDSTTTTIIYHPITCYAWDFESDGIYDYQETSSDAPDGLFDGQTTYSYGDNGTYNVTLQVTDETGATASDTCTVTVNNVAPQATILGGIGIADNYILVANYNARSYFIGIEDDGSLGSPELIDDKDYRTYGAGIGDFDNDGDFDALVGDRYNTWYYEKTADGNSFATAVSIDSTVHIYRMDFAEADFNNDGNLDAIMADYGSDYYTLYMGNGDGTFTRSTVTAPYSIIGMDTGDFNGDGNMDFIAASYNYEGVYIYLGNGNGNFQSPINLPIGDSWGVCAGDFDNDGDDDFIFGYNPVKFYPGNGDGTFGSGVNLGFPAAYAYAFAESDIDGDGNLDIVYTYSNSVYYMTGNGDGTFSFVSTTSVSSSLYGIATSSGGGAPLEVNEGDMVPFNGTFSDPGWLDTHTATWDWGDGSPTSSGTVTEENDEPFATGEVTGSHSYGDNGNYIITLAVIDDDGGVGTDTAAVNVLNVPPVADAGSDQTVDEGSIFTFNGSGTFDPGFLDELTYTWDFGDSSSPVSGINLWNPQHIYGDNGVYTVTLTVEDDDGEMDTDTVTVTVNNVAPTITALNGPLDPVSLGSSIDVDGEFNDPGVLDTHTATIDWGDGNMSDLGTVTSPIPVQTYTYGATGVYTVTLTVTDNDGGVDTEVFQYVVVYDPSDGFVTGGGWIDSPEGAYTPDPNLTGKANFGFVSKYKKGQQNPTGNTEFQFHAADMNFHSDIYDWMVIAGHKAMYKGTGTINDSGNYGFMISAIDEKLTPSTDTDMFRIKIWDKDNNDLVVYDNQIGDDEDADPTTAIGGGQIVIHKN